ncbi:MAG: LLM class flavin-dependent oxidoreductase [Chloroflexota bacterium]|nr:LLM class flavin-dependent oxidoreductase [Chloroflexota bacterium]
MTVQRPGTGTIGTTNAARGRPLKVGLLLPVIEGTMASDTARWADLVAITQRAEELNFDSLWVSDHLLFRLPGREDRPVGMWEGWSLLAALAATTSRIALGPFVSCTSFRNPALTAKMADTIDEISGGRLILGLGAGWHRPEYDAFGYPFDHRASRFEEAFTIIRSLLREGHVDFAGTFYQARDCELRPRGPRPEGPPLMIGTKGPRMLRITTPHVDAWNSDWTSSPAAVPPLRDAVDAACREVGRNLVTLERTAGVLIDLPDRDPNRSGRASVSGATEPTTKPDPPATGSPEELAELLRAFAREGIGHVQVWLDPSTVADVEAFAPVLELLDRG